MSNFFKSQNSFKIVRNNQLVNVVLSISIRIADESSNSDSFFPKENFEFIFCKNSNSKKSGKFPKFLRSFLIAIIKYS